MKMHRFSTKLLLNFSLLLEESDGFSTKECKTQEIENGALEMITAMVLC